MTVLTRGTVAAVGVSLVLLMVCVEGTGLAAASGAGVLQPAANPLAQWAYGGQASWTGTTIDGNLTLTWTASYGWSVVFTSTSVNATVTQLEEQRTVGFDVTVQLAAPRLHAQLRYHAVENDTAFANLTTAATVLVNGVPVPALGILNASNMARATLSESLTAATALKSASAFLNVSASAASFVQFDPALGLVPLNLSGVSEWSSAAVASPSAQWMIDYAWSTHSFNGTQAGNSGSGQGSWSTSTAVALTGLVVNVAPVFHDHHTRLAIQLVLIGGADLYDGFLLVPHDFDLFGGATQPFDQYSVGSASLTAGGQGEVLFLTPGRVGPSSLTAAQTTFGASTATVATAQPQGGLAPAAESSPGTTVVAQPMSVGQAHSIANCLSTGAGCSSPVGGLPRGLFFVVVVGAVVLVVAVAGLVLVTERRRIPPPVYPNARLYPPGAAGVTAHPARGTTPGSPPPPNEEDPLSHLW
ncbi:MAG TPA: hypothetical protein VEH57_00995 [Thermoplasmata archaeon]|nr:hypothetical protein [Thermoplasmata archaeon]